MSPEEKKQQDLARLIDIAVVVAPIILIQNVTFALLKEHGIATKVAASLVPIIIIAIVLNSIKSRRTKIIFTAVFFLVVIASVLIYRFAL